MKALGMIEAYGYVTALTAADAALKAAAVSIQSVEYVIGAGGGISVTVHLIGDVAAVKSAVEAGVESGEKVGKILTSHVIARTHSEVEKLMKKV